MNIAIYKGKNIQESKLMYILKLSEYYIDNSNKILKGQMGLENYNQSYDELVIDENMIKLYIYNRNI